MTILRSKKQDWKLHICLIFMAFLSVIAHSAFKNDKSILIESTYERFLVHFDGVSSFGNVVDIDGTGSEKISTLNKLKAYLALVFDDPTKLFSQKLDSLPLLRLDIPFDNIQKLRSGRVYAIKKGYLFDPEWVTGSLTHLEEKFSIKLRLKGDLPSHWTADTRFSLRVRLKRNKEQNGAQSILGMRTFSLHKLRTRQFPYEHIFQDLLAREGLPSVEHKLVRVIVNGENWGVMDMQEHFSPEMLEKNGLKESAVLRLSDDRHWLEYSRTQPTGLGLNEYWLSNPRIFVDLTGFSPKKSVDQREFQLNYVRSRLKEQDYFSVLFDKNKLKDAFRILKIWGNPHPISLANSRFYLNPYTLKLQPLMADQGPFKELRPNDDSDILTATTNGLIYIEEFGSDFNKKSQIDETLQNLTFLAEERSENSIFPGDSRLNLTIPERNASFVHQMAWKQSKSNNGYSTGTLDCANNEHNDVGDFDSIAAWFKGPASLSILPLNCQGLKILSIEGCGASIKIDEIFDVENINLTVPLSLDIDEMIWPEGSDFPYRKSATKDQPRAHWQRCMPEGLKLRYMSGSKTKTISIDRNYFVARKWNPFLRSQDSNFAFIQANAAGDYFIEKGNWEITRPTFIVGDLHVEEGTNIAFAKDAYLIVNGSLYMNGTAKKPIVFGSKVQGERWRGIYVYGDGDQRVSAKISNFYFSDTTNLSDGLLQLTGALTIYNADVELTAINISNTIAEDALNIVHSNVIVGSLRIEDTVSDAFDCDFCEGEFHSMDFKNIGGDGFDVSGSVFSASINSASKIRDKVMSVGEQSRGSITVSSVSDAHVAVAVKDAGAANVTLQNTSTTGPLVMTYLKKDFFEGETVANVRLRDSVFSTNADAFVAATGTKLIVDGVRHPNQVLNVEKLYSVGPMKKN